MPIDDPNRIDIVSTDKEGNTNLSMTAFQEWNEETIRQLHAKCRAYVEYVESGQFAIDHSESKVAVIRLVHKEPLTAEVEGYIDRLKEWLAQTELSVPIQFSTLHLDD